MLDIGKFDSKVLFQVGNIVHDSMGAATYEWEDVFWAWAHVDFKNGKSSESEDRLETSLSVEFTLKSSGLSVRKVAPKFWRIVYPTEAGALITDESQSYTITGIYMWGGRNKYKTFQTMLNENEYIISDR